MKRLSIFIFIAFLSCNQYRTIDSDDKKVIVTSNARESYEAELSKIAYTISVEKIAIGREAISAAQAKLNPMGIPFLFTDVDKLRQAKSWMYIDSIFVNNQHIIESDPLSLVIKEHTAQIILRDFNLISQTDEKALDRIEYYVKCLANSDSPHPGLVYLGLNRLGSKLTISERRELAQKQYNRSDLFMQRDAENFRKMKASLEEMTEEERAKKVGVKKILGIYDEVEYFMPRLKEFIQ